MEILIGIVLFGLIFMLAPYIIGGLMALVAIFVGIVALFVAGVKKIF